MNELASMIELLGEDATLKLVEAYGGTRRGVPKYMPEAHELRDLLGDAAFALLFQYYGGSEITMPMARHWRIEIYLKRDMKPKEIARRAGCTEAAVYAYLRQRANELQFSFSFDMSANDVVPAKQV